MTKHSPAQYNGEIRPPMGVSIDEKKNRARCEAADFILKVGDKTFDLSRGTLIMGVLNVTPDSFSDGGRFFSIDSAVKRASEMAGEGAHIIDVGGQSTRPGSDPVSEEEEQRRVIPVIEAIRKSVDCPISIDTYRAAVARSAVEAGASMINDISALSFDPRMAAIVAETGAPVVLMHIKGTPRDMQRDPRYDNLVGEIHGFLAGALARAVSAGIDSERIVLDPGIGFGKSFDDNLTLIAHIRDFFDLGRPVLIGASRKAFIGSLTGKEAPDRLWGSLGAAAAAALSGAHIVRVHDVAETRDVLLVVDAIKKTLR